MYTGDWSPDDAQAAGWGPEEEAALAQIYAGMDADARKLYDDKVLGSQMRGEIRQKIMAGTQPNKAKEMETAFEYGGRKGKAQEDADYFRRKAEESQNRPGVQVDFGRANQWDTAAAEDRLAGYESRGRAMSMADLMAKRARGEVPSIAGQRADLDIGRGIADQSSIAASARGPAALALANQTAAGNSAALTQRISNDAQVNTAQERADAEKNALAGYAGIRAGDTQQQGADLAGAGQAAGRAVAQAGFDDAQRGRNDAREAGMYGNEIGVNTTQMQGQGNKMAVKMGQQQAAVQNQQAKQARSDANVMGGIGAGASVLAGLASMFSDERLKEPAPVPDSGFEAKKAEAHRALDSYAGATQPMAVEGFGPGPARDAVGALRRRDEQDAGLFRAKQRTGAVTSWREEKDATAAEGRLGREQEAADAADKQAKRAAREEPKKLTMAERLSKGGAAALGGLGASLGQMAGQRRRDAVSRFQMPTLTPYMMRQPSGMQMKEPVALDPMPDVSNPLSRQAFGAMNAANAQLDAGSSVQGALARPQGIQTFPSDDRTKLAAAFQDGVNHADQIAAGVDPSKIKIPDYVPRSAQPGGAHGQNGVRFSRQGPEMGRAKANYDTPLSTEEEAKFKQWKAQYAPNDSGGDYDLRGAFKAGLTPGPDGHWSDEFKKPNHPTFSRESRYASQALSKAGSWDGDEYVPAHAQHGAREREVKEGDTLEARMDAVRKKLQAEYEAGAREPAPPAAEPGYASQAFGRARAMVSDERTKDRFPVISTEEAAKANRSLAGSAYTYKPEFADEAGQPPNEVNVGPMTQRMEESDVARTAVKHDETGRGVIDVPKYTKVLGTGLAAAQQQIDHDRKRIEFLMQRLRGKK